MKNILVLVEEIADQDYLINHALEMANCWGAKMLIGHVHPPTVLVVDTAIASQALRQESQFLLEKENIAKWLVFLKEYNWEEKSVSIEGNSIESLLIVIEEHEVDFVLTQSGTRSWIKEKMLSSSWSTLFADCKVPVVVFPKLEKLEKTKARGFSKTDSLSSKTIEP